MNYIAYTISFFTFAIGLSAMLSPEKMSTNYGISVKGEAIPFVISTGVRDIFMSLVILNLTYFKQFNTLAYVCFYVALVAFVDFYLVFKKGIRLTSFVHLGGMIFMAGFGVYLLMKGHSLQAL